MDWLKTMLSPKPNSTTRKPPKNMMNSPNLEQLNNKKRMHDDLNSEKDVPTILNPSEPSKKLQKNVKENSFELSGASSEKNLAFNIVPDQNSKTSTQTETTSIASSSAKDATQIQSSRNNIHPFDAFSNLPVGERLTKFLSMKGDANEPLTSQEVKMVTELLKARPSQAKINQLDHSIISLQLNRSFSKVCNKHL